MQARHPLRLYKAILRQTRSLPSNQIPEALTETRNAFRKRLTEADPGLVQEFIKEAENRLAFLKIITPNKKPNPMASGTFVFKDGNVVEGSGDPLGKRGWRDHGLDPDDLRRHERLLRRQHFMDRE